MCNAFFIRTPPTFLDMQTTWLEYYYSCTDEELESHSEIIEKVRVVLQQADPVTLEHVTCRN
jgi:hypothetical protein